jgi:hypothetical protein
MRSRLLLALVAGLLVGALMVGLAPVQAHHGASSRRLSKRITRLANRVDALTTKVNNRTRLLDRQGNYFGFIFPLQVTAPGDVCFNGDDAIWVEDPNDPTWTIVW